MPAFTFPAGYDPAVAATYGIAATNGAGVFYPTTAIQFNYEPAETDADEDTVKLDVDYDLPDSFFTKLETGYQYRSSGTEQYQVGGYTRPDGVIVQGARARHNLVLVPGSTANGASVFNPLTLPAAYNVNYAPANIVALINSISQRTPSNFYSGGRSDPGIGLPAGWLAPSSLLGGANSGLDF